MGIPMRETKEENGVTEKWLSAADTHQTWPKGGLCRIPFSHTLGRGLSSGTEAVWHPGDTSIGY